MPPHFALGPLQNPAQLERVRNLISATEASGDRLSNGTAPRGTGGYFIPVTLVDDPDDDSRIVREEQFGPVLPLLRFRDEESGACMFSSSLLRTAACRPTAMYVATTR